jgi:thiol:disulfide interchange protein
MGRSGSMVVVLAVVVALVQTAGCRKSLVDVPITWHADLDAAASLSRAQQKPMLVYFGASWDTAAKELEHESFTDPEVRELLARRFVALRVDATDDEDPHTIALSRYFKVVGDPTIVVMAPDGVTELVRFEEYIAPRPLARILAAASEPGGSSEAAARFEMARYRRAQEERWRHAYGNP